MFMSSNSTVRKQNLEEILIQANRKKINKGIRCSPLSHSFNCFGKSTKEIMMWKSKKKNWISQWKKKKILHHVLASLKKGIVNFISGCARNPRRLGPGNSQAVTLFWTTIWRESVLFLVYFTYIFQFLFFWSKNKWTYVLILTSRFGRHSFRQIEMLSNKQLTV